MSGQAFAGLWTRRGAMILTLAGAGPEGVPEALAAREVAAL